MVILDMATFSSRSLRQGLVAPARTLPGSHSQQQRAGRLVDRELKRLLDCGPAKFAGLVIQPHHRLTRAAAGVVQQDEMTLPVELLRADAVLHQRKFDVLNLKAGFLANLAPQSVQTTFAPIHLAPGNPPKIRPFT